MKYRIGYRTFKTALAVPIAVYLAMLINLESYTTAGVIAILCVQPTKRRSLRFALDIFFCALAGTILALVILSLFGYTILGLGLLFLFYIPIPVTFNIRNGIVIGAVVILALFVSGDITLDVIKNSFWLVAIGGGTALSMNLFMPNITETLAKRKIAIEDDYRKVFKQIASHLNGYGHEENTEVLNGLHKEIDRAKSLAFVDIENHFLRHEDRLYQYFHMRQDQLGILKRIDELAKSVKTHSEESVKIAQFILGLTDSLHHFKSTKTNREMLTVMTNDFENLPLPTSKETFIHRATLLQLLKELNAYLLVKESMQEVNDAVMKKESGTKSVRSR